MEDFKKSLDNVELKEVYDVYLKLIALLDELNKNIKQLPPKEEL